MSYFKKSNKSIEFLKWRNEHQICEQAYYVWQRRIRQDTYDQMQSIQKSLPVVSAKEDISFSDFPMPKQNIQVSRTVKQAFTQP